MLRVLLVALLAVVACAGPAMPPTPPPPAAVDDGTLVRLMVQEGAYLMQERAIQERDDATLARVWATYDHIDVPRNARLLVIQNSAFGTQVEILDGPYAGRRGWLASVTPLP